MYKAILKQKYKTREKPANIKPTTSPRAQGAMTRTCCISEKLANPSSNFTLVPNWVSSEGPEYK
jgi:hypothetical protein